MNWISVKDRLPEVDGEDYLVFNKRGVTIATYIGHACSKSYWIGRQGRTHGLSTVTYWMPLPEPPKEDN